MNAARGLNGLYHVVGESIVTKTECYAVGCGRSSFQLSFAACGVIVCPIGGICSILFGSLVKDL